MQHKHSMQSIHSDEDLGGPKKHNHRPNIGLREKVQTFRLHSLASAVYSPPPGEHMDAMICHEAFRTNLGYVKCLLVLESNTVPYMATHMYT